MDAEDDTKDTVEGGLFGHSPKRFGIASLVAACLVWACWPLVVIVGISLVLLIEIPLVLFAVIIGLLGFGGGIIYKDAIACVTAAIALTLVGVGAASSFHALTNF